MNENNIEPIYARGFFNMNNFGDTSQFTVFYYYDPDGYYATLKREKLKKEVHKIRKNMQYYLDKEIIKINGTRIRAKVIFTRIGLLDVTHPFIEFLIKFKGELRSGENEYYDVYNEEVAEYPFEAIWVLPGKIISYQLSGKVRVKDNILYLKVRKGTKIAGKEKITFLI